MSKWNSREKPLSAAIPCLGGSVCEQKMENAGIIKGVC